MDRRPSRPNPTTSHPRPCSRPRRRARRVAAACAAAALLALGACSVVPEADQFHRREYAVDVVYDFPPVGAHEVVVPQSKPNFTVLALETEPAGLREVFDDRQRRLRVPVGVTRLFLSCRYRVYGSPADRSPAASLRPEDLFPGGSIVLVVGDE